jgi:hypothetical protein
MQDQAEWSEHASFMDALAEDGFIVLGGPVGDGNRFMFLIEAESEEEIRLASPTIRTRPANGSSWPASSPGSWSSAILTPADDAYLEGQCPTKNGRRRSLLSGRAAQRNCVRLIPRSTLASAHSMKG